jgi:hypothetical protein
MKQDSRSHQPSRRGSHSLLAAFSLTLVLSSCASTDEVQQRVDRRSSFLDEAAEKAEIRRDAREERYERQWDRLMD